MADNPEVQEAKAKLRTLVIPAVQTLEDLMSSEHAGIRLGASREILDRGGVPAKHGVDVQVEIGLDDEIESLLGSVRRQLEAKNRIARGENTLFADGIDDAQLVEDEEAAPVGEQAAERIGVALDDIAVVGEVVESAAWWQAAPPDEAK